MNREYLDSQLKQALAKMIPEQLYFNTGSQCLCWISKQSVCGTYVLETELLHICWEVEETLDMKQKLIYAENIFNQLRDQECVYPWYGACYIVAHATYEQRTIALAKVKGVEIV
jgi:hypothetical protein